MPRQYLPYECLCVIAQGHEQGASSCSVLFLFLYRLFKSIVRLADVGKKRITDNAVLPLEWTGLGREAARTNKVTRFSILQSMIHRGKNIESLSTPSPDPSLSLKDITGEFTSESWQRSDSRRMRPELSNFVLTADSLLSSSSFPCCSSHTR